MSRDKTKVGNANIWSRKERPARPRRRRRAYHHGDLRRTLIEAALDHVSEHGAEDVSLRALARRVGVSTAAPYRHFADKDELLAAVAAECGLELLAALRKAADACGPDDALGRFQATALAQVRFAAQHPAHLRVLELPGIRSRMPRAAREELDAWYAAERERLRAAQRSGLLANFPIDELLLSARSLVIGLCHLLAGGDPQVGHLSTRDIATTARAVTRIFALGALPRRPGVGK